MNDELRELWDRLRDPYWRADHPEITAVLIAIITGLIGLAFAWVEVNFIRRPPETEE